MLSTSTAGCTGGTKAIVAVGRRLLVAVWHVLAKACADRFADPLNVARAFMGLTYDIACTNCPTVRPHRGTRASSSIGWASASDEPFLLVPQVQAGVTFACDWFAPPYGADIARFDNKPTLFHAHSAYGVEKGGE
ncbi:MAG: hypothetical protein U0X20_07460 [Caldilineaceae bacterium]